MTLDQPIGDDNRGKIATRNIRSQGSTSRANTRRDEPRNTDIPDPVYEGTRTRKHSETGPSARYHLFI